MMTITTLIARLEALRAQHGDLPCVTPGVDESELDDIGEPELVWAMRDMRQDGNVGRHDRLKGHKDGASACVLINF